MSDKKLTDEEIIKTLERCSKGDGCFGCAKAYAHSANCIRILETECLDLINRQKAENEMLKKRISDKKHALFEQQEYTAELQQTLETKCDDCDNIRLSRPEYWKAIKAAKAETYKEFAERLKEEIRLEDDCDYNCRECCYECNDYVIAIENLLKEMVGEEE